MRLVSSGFGWRAAALVAALLIAPQAAAAIIVPVAAAVATIPIAASIAAASILAKVTRDALMLELDHEHPGYDLARNMGYGSEEHRLAIRRLGPSPIHRRSFGDVSQRWLFS